MTRTWISSLLLAVVAALSAATAEAAPIGVTTVLAQNGDPAPTGPGNFTFYGRPALNDAGQVAFAALLEGPGVDSTNGLALYRLGDAGAVQIARDGDALPTGQGNFRSLSSYFDLNAAGQVAFSATLSGDGVTSANDRALYRFGDAGTVQIAREGDALPTGPGNFKSIRTTEIAFNDAGQLAFSASLEGAGIDSTNDVALYRFGDGGIVEIAREGDAAPTGSGSFKSIGNIALNDAGQAAFFAVLSDGGITNRALYRFGEAGTVQIARERDALPTGPGRFASLSSTIAFNNEGQAAFSATVTGREVAAVSEDALYRVSDAGSVEFARDGDAPPAGPGVFSYFSSDIVLNDAGQAALFATVSNPGVTEGALYRFGDAGAVRVAHQGEALPTGPGAFSGFFDIALNDAGQVAFYASLGGPGVDATNSIGLYLYDDRLGLITVARKGDAFLGSTITNLRFGDGFNNLGQLAYSFTLANGNSGIALFTVPEPTAAALLTLGMTTLLRRRVRVV